MLQRKLHITLFLLGCIGAFTCFSQNISVRASTNRDKIMIGEPIELKLEVLAPADANIKWFPLDSLEHFEFIDKAKIDTLAETSGNKYLQTVTLTSFDSGRWHIPSLPLEMGNKSYLTDSLPVSVAFSAFDSTKAYHDIKDIVAVEVPSLDYLNWIIAGATFISLLAMIYFIRKKIVKPAIITPTQPVSRFSPLQEALMALQKLEQEPVIDATNIKTFHTQLNDVLRHFVYRKSGVATMEKTSSELMLQLKNYNIPTESFTPLAQTLRMNDAVKFAKFVPETVENKKALGIIRKSIELLDKAINGAM